jgi:Transposase IS4
MLSTQHKGAAREAEGKKKPETVLYYNRNKCGVDVLDYMCREMSTKAACRRWPLAVFFNILDLAGVNAWIIYKLKTGSNISRRKFLFELSNQLRESEVSRKALEVVESCQLSGKLKKRVTCEVRSNCKRNRTTTKCIECKRPVCGQCLAGVCSRCKSV